MHVAVIGGGIVGHCAALKLAELGAVVTLYDPPGSDAAPSWGNIGHIAIEQVVPLASWATLRTLPRRLGGSIGLPIVGAHRWLPFGLRLTRYASGGSVARGTAALQTLLSHAVPAWRRLAASWPDSDLLRTDGHLIVWETDRSARSGREHWLASPVGSVQICEASPDDIAWINAIAPSARARAIRIEQTGQIRDLKKLRSRLGLSMVNLGVQRIPHFARRIEPQAQGVLVHDLAGAAHSFDAALVCGGIGSKKLLEAVGHSVPMIAERGYHLHAETVFEGAKAPPIVFEDRGIVVNCFRNGTRVAGFAEFTDDSAPADHCKWRLLARHAHELGISLGAQPRAWLGSRPTLPDYLPAIGSSDRLPNVHYAFGHQHLGLTLAPLTAELIADRIMHGSQTVDLSPFRLERFG